VFLYPSPLGRPWKAKR